MLVCISLSGCVSTRYYDSLPEARSGILAYHDASDPDAARAVSITRRLLTSRPIPVEQVYIFTSNLRDPKTGNRVYALENNAGAIRCGEGTLPPYGCIYLGMNLIRKLSDDALAGVLAHELGHLEKGHLGSNRVNIALGIAQVAPNLCQKTPDPHVTLIMCGIGVGISLASYVVAAETAGMDRDIEREADQAAWDRLATSGYCAGRTMKTVFEELSELAPAGGQGDIFSTHPSYSERWANADPSCGNTVIVREAAKEHDRAKDAERRAQLKLVDERQQVQHRNNPSSTNTPIETQVASAPVSRFSEHIREEMRPTRIRGTDGAQMTLVPEGEFLYGADPQRASLPAFYIDTFEVTTNLYAAFMRTSGRQKPEHWDDVRFDRDGDKPVIGVEWSEADAYCRYYGKRLPTEQEWEKAARGTDGRIYPWGNKEPTVAMANFGPSGCGPFCNVYEEKLQPVNGYEDGKSQYGIFNMAGNAGEWVKEKRIRGGHWVSDARGLRTSLRLKEITHTWGARWVLGFRCAQDVS